MAVLTESTEADLNEGLTFTNDLYVFTVPGAAGRVEQVVIPVPHDDVLGVITDKVGAIDVPQKLSGFRAQYRWHRSSRPTRKEFASVYESLGSLMAMKVKIVDALPVTVGLTYNLRLQHALACILADMHTGVSAAKAFAKHPEIFDGAAIGQIAAGEATARLDMTFRAMARHIELLEKVREHTVIALIYPAGIATTLYGIISALLYFLMPRLTDAFNAMQVRLPLSTQVIVWMGEVVHKWPFVLLSGPAGVFLLWSMRSALARPLLALLRKIPVFGNHYLRSQVATTVGSLSGLLNNGIGLHEALGLVAQTASDPAIRDAFLDARACMDGGDKAPAAFSSVYALFGRVSANLRAAVEIGTSGGELASTLESASEKYQSDFIKGSEVLQRVIQPTATVFIGLVVSAFVLSAYYPILTASTQVSR